MIDQTQNSPASLLVESEENSSLRKPRLSAFRILTSLHQLQPFFSRASIDTFEGVYSSSGVDWDAVEDDMMAEIFEDGDR